MDRKKYLEMCQKASMFNDGVCGIKDNIPDELKISHNGTIYYPKSYELSFDKGIAIHTAILHELNANSIMYVRLERLKL